MDAWCTPQPVRQAHLADVRAKLNRRGLPARCLDRHRQYERNPLPMPAHNGFGPDDGSD